MVRNCEPGTWRKSIYHHQRRIAENLQQHGQKDGSDCSAAEHVDE